MAGHLDHLFINKKDGTKWTLNSWTGNDGGLGRFIEIPGKYTESGVDYQICLTSETRFSDMLMSLTFKAVDNQKVGFSGELTSFFKNSGSSVVETVDLSGLDVSNVKSMEGMFQECKRLEKVTFDNEFDATHVENMSYMFQRCHALKEITLKQVILRIWRICLVPVRN